MTHGASRIRVLKIRGRRANFLLLAQGRSRGLILCKGFRGKAVAIRARVNHSKMGNTLGLLARQGKGHVSIATSLDT